MEPAMLCLLAVLVTPWETRNMDYPDFDRLARTMTLNAGASRRSLLRRMAASALASPMGFLGITSARADGDEDKTNKKEKDRGNDKADNNNNSVNASGGVATSSSQSNQTVVNAN